MEQLGVIGLSWRHASSEDVARFHLPKAVQADELSAFARRMHLQEVVYLATCSRVELIYRSEVRPDPAELRRRMFESFASRRPQPGEAERTLRAWAGEGAAEHLLLVATGLDSAQLGETEVLGQLREALAASRELGLASGVLGFVVEEAIKVARRLRRETGLDLGQTSLAQIALAHLAPQPSDAPAGLREEASPVTPAHTLPVALVGVSAMTERCARGLQESDTPVVWINRTPEKAQRALSAAGVRGEARSFEQFAADPCGVAGIVCATGSLDPVLDVALLQEIAQHNPMAKIVDLGVPPDVDAGDAASAGLAYLGMDQILARADRTSQDRQARAADARIGIDQALLLLRERIGTSALGPIARAVQEHYRHSAQSGLQRLFRKELAGLDEAQQEQLLQWSAGFAAQMAHLPTTGLRQVVREQGQGALHAFLSHAPQDLARKIRRAVVEEQERQAVQTGPASEVTQSAESHGVAPTGAPPSSSPSATSASPSGHPFADPENVAADGDTTSRSHGAGPLDSAHGQLGRAPENEARQAEDSQTQPSQTAGLRETSSLNAAPSRPSGTQASDSHGGTHRGSSTSPQRDPGAPKTEEASS